MPDKITYEWIFSVSRQTDIHSCRATDDAARSAVLSSALTQQNICACTVSIGSFIRLFYPQCSDIRTVIYLRTQVFHSSWTSEMRVSRTRYTHQSNGTQLRITSMVFTLPETPSPHAAERTEDFHTYFTGGSCLLQWMYIRYVCGINGEKAKFWHNWCEKPSTVPHTSWNFYLPFYQLSGWFWNNKFAILFMHLHLSPLYSAQNFIMDLCKTSVLR